MYGAVESAASMGESASDISMGGESPDQPFGLIAWLLAGGTGAAIQREGNQP
jgi:hypothetical protein